MFWIKLKLKLYQKLKFLWNMDTLITQKTSSKSFNSIFSLKFNADDQLFSVKNDTWHGNYAQNYYLSPYAATLPLQHPSAAKTKIIHSVNESCPMIPHPQWKFSEKSKPVKKHLAQDITNLLAKNVIPKTNLSTNTSNRFLEHWNFFES